MCDRQQGPTNTCGLSCLGEEEQPLLAGKQPRHSPLALRGEAGREEKELRGGTARSEGDLEGQT